MKDFEVFKSFLNFHAGWLLIDLQLKQEESFRFLINNDHPIRDAFKVECFSCIELVYNRLFNLQFHFGLELNKIE